MINICHVGILKKFNITNIMEIKKCKMFYGLYLGHFDERGRKLIEEGSL
jgi:hypothetical protein